MKYIYKKKNTPDKYPFLFYGASPEILSTTFPIIIRYGEALGYEIKFFKEPNASIQEKISYTINFELSSSPITYGKFTGWREWLYIELTSANLNFKIRNILYKLKFIWQDTLIKLNNIWEIEEVRCLPCIKSISKWDNWTIQNKTNPSEGPAWPEPNSKIANKKSLFGVDIKILSENSLGKKINRFPITVSHIWKFWNYKNDITIIKGKKRILLLENAYGFKFSKPTRNLLYDYIDNIGCSFDAWNSCHDIPNLLQVIYPIRGKSVIDSLIEDLHLNIHKYKGVIYLSNFDCFLGFFCNIFSIGTPYRHEQVFIYPILHKKPYYLLEEGKFFRLESEYIYEITSSNILKTKAFSNPKFVIPFYNSGWIRYLLCFPNKKSIDRLVKGWAIFFKNEKKNCSTFILNKKKSKGSAQILYWLFSSFFLNHKTNLKEIIKIAENHRSQIVRSATDLIKEVNDKKKVSLHSKYVKELRQTKLIFLGNLENSQ